MARYVLLDAGVIGLLVSEPTRATVGGGKVWLQTLLTRADVTLPDIAVYEVRRELLRLGASAKLGRLEGLCSILNRTEVTLDAWGKAAEFWAGVRKAGKPTADPQALDADAILAGVAVTLGLPEDEVMIATTNVRHLSRFSGVDARDWRTIR